MKKENKTKVICAAVVMASGFVFLSDKLRAPYETWLFSQSGDQAVLHCLEYLGIGFYAVTLFLYAWLTEAERNYIFSFLHGRITRNMKYALCGAAAGFIMAAASAGIAVLHGDLSIHSFSFLPLPLLFLSLITVFLQASSEELLFRSFLFSKMCGEGVPYLPAALISSLFFSLLHAAAPGYGFLPFLCITMIGMQFALSYHFFKTPWFAFLCHTMWNYTMDFILGLPDSGQPAVISFFQTSVHKNSVFYSAAFGMEGTITAVLLNFSACLLIVYIGKRYESDQNKKTV